MEAISFVIKTTIITIAILLFMQIQWGKETLEDYTMDAITSSSVVRPLNETASGAVVFGRNAWHRFIRSFDSAPGQRRLPNIFQRSKQAFTNAGSEGADAVRTASRTTVDEMKDFNSHQTFHELRERAAAEGRKIRAKFIDETKVPQDPTQQNKSDRTGTVLDDE